MFTEKTHARHAAELGFLYKHLEELGWEAKLIDKSALFPLNTLIGATETEAGIVRTFSFAFIPTPDDDEASILLLQFYVPLSKEFPPENRAALDRLLTEINGLLAIGQYSIKDDQEIHFRYVWSVPSAGTINKEAFVDTLIMVDYMQDIFNDAVISVATGHKDWQTALQDVTGQE